MEGRAETPEQKREILDQLFLLWCQVPNLRLGQLIYAIGSNALEIGRVFWVEDQELIQEIHKFVRKTRSGPEENSDQSESGA